ncbi:MAG: orotidine-5'-phosphate decarboxylase [Alphaproteobacteria bacterium]|nr:orotidine-5'-phosphate decarboxylase [Alphaproteobacteria bacterium]
MPINPVFCAIDTNDMERALHLARSLKGTVGGLKLGMEFVYSSCALSVDLIRGLCEDLPIFLDLKFHDIPNTVAAAVRAVAPLAPYMINVHASGGRDMMRAAAEAAASLGPERPLVVAVTVLTSLDRNDIGEIGVAGTVESQVERLAVLAKECGLDGVVCSAREIRAVRRACGPGFTLVVPGLRPAWAVANDQKRIETPAEAKAAGADILVIGRPITAAADPAAAARRIVDELAPAT